MKIESRPAMLIMLSIFGILMLLSCLCSCTSKSGSRSIEAAKPVLHTFVVSTSNGTDTILANSFANGVGTYRRHVWFYDNNDKVIGIVICPDELNLTIRMIK